MKLIQFFIISVGLCLVVFSSIISIAGTVTKISDKKVILVFDNEVVPTTNSKILILDQDSHKEIGLVEIIKVKDSRALGLLKKGTAKPGDTADIYSKNQNDHRVPAKENFNEILDPSKKERKGGARLSYGVGAEFINTRVMVKTTGNSGELDGSGIGMRGAIEYSLSNKWILFGSLGLNQFNMTSDVTEVPEIKNTYLGVDGVVRYAFNKKTEGLWIGGGAGYLLTMSSNTKPKPGNEFAIIGSAGYNIKVSKSYFSLKGDLLWFQSKKLGDYNYQPYQLLVGGVYFF